MSRSSSVLYVLALTCLCSCLTVDLPELRRDVELSFECDSCQSFSIAGYAYWDIPTIPKNEEVMVVYRDSLRQRSYLYTSFSRSTPSMPQEADTSRDNAVSFLKDAHGLPSFSLFHSIAPEEIIGDTMFTGSLQFYWPNHDSVISIPTRAIEAIIPFEQEATIPKAWAKYRKVDWLPTAALLLGWLVITVGFLVFVLLLSNYDSP